MKIPNTPELQKCLTDGGYPRLASEPDFDFDATDEATFQVSLQVVAKQHPELSTPDQEEHLKARAAYRTILLRQSRNPNAQGMTGRLDTQFQSLFNQLSALLVVVAEQAKDDRTYYASQHQRHKENQDRSHEINESVAEHAKEVMETLGVWKSEISKADLTLLQFVRDIALQTNRGLDFVADTVNDASNAVKEQLTEISKQIITRIQLTSDEADKVADTNHTELKERLEALYKYQYDKDTTFDVDFTKFKKKLKWWLIAAAVLFALLILAAPHLHAQAQVPTLPSYVVAACGDALPANFNVIGGRSFLVRDMNGLLCAGVTVSASVNTTGLASSANQTNGLQKVQIVDAGGDVATVTGNALDVNAVVNIPSALTVTTQLGTGSGTVVVTGSASDGTTATFSPVQVGGVDSTGKVQAVAVDPNGTTVIVGGTTALSVTGTITAVTSITNPVTVGNTVTTTFLTSNIATNISQLGGTTISAATTSGIMPVAGTGTAGVNQPTALAVQGITGGIAQPISGTVTITDGAGAVNVIVDSGVITTVSAVTAISNALPAGANAIGKLAANDGVDIGDVTINNLAGNPVIVSFVTSNISTNTAQLGGTVISAAVTAGMMPVSGTVNAGQNNLVALPIQGVTSGVPVSENITQLGTTAISTAVTAGIMPVAGTVTAGTNNASALPIQGVTGGVPIVVNQTQLNGVTVLTGSGTSGTSQRVTIANPDPCVSGYTKAVYVISIATSTTVVTGSTSQVPYICSINIGPIASATNVAAVTGTGTLCATNIAGLFGGTTAANGWNFAANGGITMGNGQGWITKGSLSAGNICLILSAANQINGSITYVIAP